MPALPPLPAAVRLPPHRSMLRLGPHARLLGLDPATALAVDDLPPPLAQMLDDLAEPTDCTRLVESAVRRGADAGQAEALLRKLVGAGAVVDAAGPQRRARERAASAAVVVGNGPLAVGILVGLAAAGLGAVHADVTGTVVAADLGTGFLDADRGTDRAAAAAAAVRRVVPTARTGPPPRRLDPDLVVLADASAPDPVRVARLMASRTEHLLVRLRDGIGVVGPLVLPGRSACLGCLDLHRRARDPSWTTVAAQLVDRPGRADAACTAATAALGTAQALAALDGPVAGVPVPPVLDATLELDPGAATLVHRPWAPHSDCGCGAGRGLSGDAACAGAFAGGTIMT